MSGGKKTLYLKAQLNKAFKSLENHSDTQLKVRHLLLCRKCIHTPIFYTAYLLCVAGKLESISDDFRHEAGLHPGQVVNQPQG